MQQGAQLMLYGMGTVFVFLAVLVLASSAMSAIFQRFVKPADAVTTPSTKRVANQNTDVNDERLVAVISAAIHKYRSRHK